MSIKEALHLFDIGKITVSLCARTLEIARDHFAIEFAEWCIESEGEDYNKYKYRNRTELLEIYKKEKGL